MKQKAFFIIFKGLPVVKICLRPESAPLKYCFIALPGCINIKNFLQHCTAFDTSMKKIYSLCLLNMFCKLMKNGRSNVRLTAKGFVDNIQNTEM